MVNTLLQSERASQQALKWSDSGYASLGADFACAVAPVPLNEPFWIAYNQALGDGLGLAGLDWQANLPAFAGNGTLAGSTPVASAYSGHQFGIWAGQLGDGRALLLGTLDTPDGDVELQLKGAGRTPFSRMGDGRAVLRSSIREYLCSEAMHALGIPTTRALALVGSHTAVRRETLETAAVLARTAPSFVRFGHFEHFSMHRQPRQLRELANFVLEKYYPQTIADLKGANPYAELLRVVAERSAHLMARWLSAGFVHGVMNTDNMSILGLTLDYGPFQFLDGFEPRRITNHSDQQGRYTLQMQASIGHWNVMKLAAAMLPLLDSQAQMESALEAYRQGFARFFASEMAKKLGGVNEADTDAVMPVSTELLNLLARERTDWSIFWRRLSHAAAEQDFAPVQRMFADKAAIDGWLASYRQWLETHADSESIQAMLWRNPKYVLRNYLAEKAIADARNGDFAEFHLLVHLLQNPFDEHPDHNDQADFPPSWANDIEVSCSS